MCLQPCPSTFSDRKNAGTLTSDSNSQAHLWEIRTFFWAKNKSSLSKRDASVVLCVFTANQDNLLHWVLSSDSRLKAIISLILICHATHPSLSPALLPGAKCVFRKSGLFFIGSLWGISWFLMGQIFQIKCSAFLSYFNICASSSEPTTERRNTQRAGERRRTCQRKRKVIHS